MKSKDNLFSFQKQKDESEEALLQRKELTSRIYDAILPMLGPEQAGELLQRFKAHLDAGPVANLRPVVEQRCEICEAPTKIEEQGDEYHYFTACTKCGYMDVLKK